ncbi:hypothetical protein IFM89_036777 [Coptis chinensis]|uniref:K Homology domain-containing protein n=1 Tax=Coptis chinensis TaxID=261450 RepID=A0A835LU78_9MAGN|nr:hypothetical protein IFM89_036777 [Coptis chinensis]
MIIGTGGKNIRRFENISGARIHVVDRCLRPYPETREVDLTGTPQQVSRAEQLIKAYIPQDAMVSKNFSCNSPSRHAERFIMVDGFKVKEKYAELYRAIKAENGDIRRPSILDASEMAVVWLISDILLIVHAMCQMPMLHVTLDVFEDWNIKICLAEHLGYNVAWLREHYENLKKEFERNRISDTRVSDLEVEDDSSESLDQVISLFELRVEDAKENLSVLQSESDAICAWVEKEKQEKDGVRHLSLLNGVFRFLNCLLSSKICFFCVLVVAMFMMLP